MTTLSQLKKSSGSIERLNKELDKIKNGNKFVKEVDARFWKPEVDAAGNGFAIIRFLPAPPQDGEDALMWTSYSEHGFPGPKGRKGPWYIEKSLTSLGQPDPVAQFNKKLWASEKKHLIQYARTVTRKKLTYITNIQVIADPKNPANEGGVFLYRFGKKMFENKIQEAMHPAFDAKGRPAEVDGKNNPDYTPTNAFNPFDMWTGANFKLRIRKVADFPNYDESVFEAVSELGTSDEERLAIHAKEYSLKEFTDPKTFKTYDELLAQLNKVLEIDTQAWTDRDPLPGQNRVASTPAPVQAAPEPTNIEEVTIPDDDEEDAEFAERFKKLRG